MFEPMDDHANDFDYGPPGQPDPEATESMVLFCSGLMEDPIDERDYREKEAAEFYSDLAFLARKERSERNQEFTSHELEDLDEQ
jgi:hypothetical protein